MSRDIIEYGKVPRYIIRCGYCGTLFTYYRSDVYRTRKMGRKMVSCPRCDEHLKPTYVKYYEEAGE